VVGEGPESIAAEDFAQVEAGLWLEGPVAVADWAWLERSWQAPAAFWKALHGQWERRQPGVTKSAPSRHYDFHHDLIGRQRDSTTPALACFESGAWQTWSYAELGAAVEGLAARWEQAGVEAGDILAILHPPGPRWLVSVLAGLRLGLVVSVLPPQGPAFVQRRLENLAPRWLALEPLWLRRLPESWRDSALPDEAVATAPTRRSHVYAGTDVVALCFDPASATPDVPRPLDADGLYLGALRDGFLALGVRPGSFCAAPGWHFLESQPGMALAVLLCGGCWVEIELAEVEQNPARLLEQPITVLGVSLELREVLRKQPPQGVKPWRYWFRHPAESQDLSSWTEFVTGLGLEDCYAGNLLWNTALGGALLFSVRRKGAAHPETVPAAAACWQLGAVAAPELPALGGSGRLCLGQRGGKEIVWTPTPYLLTRNRGGWLHLGQYPKGRVGRTYPVQEVLDVLAGRVAYSALVEMPTGVGDPLQVLLVFGEAADEESLRTRIAGEMGREFLPDRIEHLKLLPRRDEEGKADPAWCQAHYPTGELHRRQRDPVYQALSELKRALLALDG